MRKDCTYSVVKNLGNGNFTKSIAAGCSTISCIGKQFASGIFGIYISPGFLDSSYLDLPFVCNICAFSSKKTLPIWAAKFTYLEDLPVCFHCCFFTRFFFNQNHRCSTVEKQTHQPIINLHQASSGDAILDVNPNLLIATFLQNHGNFEG